MKSYDIRLVKDHRPDAGEAATSRSIEPAGLARDLDMVQALLHERLRLALGLDEDTSKMSSVLLGIPLRILVDEFPTTDRGLPDRYRGGIWVFAGKFGEFGPRQNSLIGDLARLSVLLANTAIDAKASDEMERSAVGRYKILYAQAPIARAQSAWFYGSKRVWDKELFSIDSSLSHHSLDEWSVHLRNDTLADLVSDAVEISNDVIASCIGANLDMTPWSKLVFLRGFIHGVGMLSLSVVANVLRLNGDVEIDCTIDDECRGYLRCNTDNRSNAGLLLHAIYALLSSKPNRQKNGEQDTGKMTVVRLLLPNCDGGKCELVFEFEFYSESDRNAVENALWLDISEREREVGQQGNTACLLMRLATTAFDEDGAQKADAEHTRIGEMGLKLTFRFPYIFA
jgi:hypothetical protein